MPAPWRAGLDHSDRDHRQRDGRLFPGGHYTGDPLMLRLILGFLGGPVTKIGQALADAHKTRANAETDQERIAADERIARLEARRDVLIAEQGHWLTRIGRPLFIIPLGIWWTAVIADSIFHWQWNVAALPDPLGDWAAVIVSALFLSEAGEKIAGRISRR